MSDLDARVADLAARYRPIAEKILKEVIRIPADHVDRPRDAGGDPSCGLSNHEKPRLEYLKRVIVEIGAVRRAEDVGHGLRGQDDEHRIDARVGERHLDGLGDALRARVPQHVDRIGGKPVQHLRQAHGERVDVPGGEFHGL